MAADDIISACLRFVDESKKDRGARWHALVHNGPPILIVIRKFHGFASSTVGGGKFFEANGVDWSCHKIVTKLPTCTNVS